MTVSYAFEVATCKGFGCFLKLLLRWHASIYKLLWLDTIIYMACYYSLIYIYEYGLNKEQKKLAAKIVLFFKESSTLIPVMFVLGFYVSIVVSRWWQQHMTLPWPDSAAVYVSALLGGRDERGRLMRRTIMRYVCLSLTIVLTMISPRVKRRFPNLEQIRDAGLLLDNEMYILKAISEKFNLQKNYWIPIVWATSVAIRARKENRIRDDAALKTIIDSLNAFRDMLMRLLGYDMISIPLVYTQVVTIAVYTFFIATLVGHMYIEDSDNKIQLADPMYPFIAMLEFLFFMGWLKVAESLISPFGDDDDDVELNWLIDRNLTVCYLIVDEMHNEYPELVKDQYWDEKYPHIPPVSLTDENLVKKMKSRMDVGFVINNIESVHPNYEPSDSYIQISEGMEERFDNEFGEEISSRSTTYIPSEKSADDFELLRRQRSDERRRRLTPAFGITQQSSNIQNQNENTNDEDVISNVISKHDNVLDPK